MTTRNVAIDVLKGGLVVLMLASHVVELLGDGREPAVLCGLSRAAELCCFSGFLFAFGYGSYISYFRTTTDAPCGRIVKTAAKILVAFYISGIARVFFHAEMGLDLKTLADVLSLRRIPSYSEFLVTFALMILSAAILFKPIKTVLSRPATLFLLILGLLATTFIPYDQVTNPHIGLLIGTAQSASYPAVQYAPLFLLGMYFAKNDIRYSRAVLGVGGVLAAAFLLQYAFGAAPSRFPPSLTWILGSMAGVYLLFLFSLGISRTPYCGRALQVIGHNVLFYLVASNLVLFAVQAVHPRCHLGIGACLAFTAALVAAIQAFIWMVRVPAG